jgi:hypothetical protein
VEICIQGHNHAILQPRQRQDLYVFCRPHFDIANMHRVNSLRTQQRSSGSGQTLVK